VTVLGGITTLAQKTYSARLPIDKDSTLVSVAVACEAGNANVGLQTIRNGVALGSVMTLLSGNTYQAFPVSYPCSAGDVIQFACVTPVGSVPPKSVTIQYRWVIA
jgi:hypothetical protein